MASATSHRASAHAVQDRVHLARCPQPGVSLMAEGRDGRRERARESGGYFSLPPAGATGVAGGPGTVGSFAAR